MSTSPQYPYDTRLNVLHQHLELIDEKGAFGWRLLTSLDRIFDASLAPETCLEFPVFANLIQDSIRQAKAETSLVLRARSQAWPRYWRSLAWWQGPRCRS